MCVRNEEKVLEILNWQVTRRSRLGSRFPLSPLLPSLLTTMFLPATAFSALPPSPDVAPAVNHLTNKLDPQRDNAKNGDRVFFCADDELQYFPFCADFGPMHFGMTYRFITMLRTTIEQAKREDKKVVVYTMADAVSRTNTAMLLILYLVLEKGYSAEEACLPLTFAGRNPFLPFRDASFQPVTFELHFIDIARGVQKAHGHGMIDLATFDIELYEYCDHPSMADLHVIVPGKFVAMKGPHTRASFRDGVQFLPPSRYFDLFAKFGVTAVVRLNSEQYPAKAFRDAGFNHYDIIYDDCTNPDQAVIDAWWEVCRQEKGAIAVHCKAGLGRTGTLICLWLMRKYKFTGREAIGYNRLLRPGSILGPQQQYLVSKEQEMWALGDPDLPPKRETWASVGTASGKKLLPRRMRMSSRSPERAQAPAAEGKSKAKGGLLDEATAIASKILAQENTDAMNRRAAEMSAAARGKDCSRFSRSSSADKDSPSKKKTGSSEHKNGLGALLV